MISFIVICWLTLKIGRSNIRQDGGSRQISTSYNLAPRYGAPFCDDQLCRNAFASFLGARPRRWQISLREILLPASLKKENFVFFLLAILGISLQGRGANARRNSAPPAKRGENTLHAVGYFTHASIFPSKGFRTLLATSPLLHDNIFMEIVCKRFDENAPRRRLTVGLVRGYWIMVTVSRRV